MSLPMEIESRMEGIRSEIERGGAELVDVLYRRANQRAFLTFLVDKAGGINLEECAEINRHLGEYFDRLSEGGGEGIGFLHGSYFLEVSSPGLDRPLKTPKDLKRVLGQMLRVQVRDTRGTVNTVTGKLVALTEVSIELENRAGKQVVLLDGILKATREVNWKKQGN